MFRIVTQVYTIDYVRFVRAVGTNDQQESVAAVGRAVVGAPSYGMPETCDVSGAGRRGRGML